MANKKAKIAIGVGAGLVAAGAAAGYYFFASKNAKHNRKIVTSWADKLKQDTEKELEALGKMEKSAVTNIIEKVAVAYKNIEGISAKDLTAVVAELKKNWQKLVKAK